MFKTVIFDLDGTILDSKYDWKRIRKELDLEERSILDHLYSLAEKEKKRKKLLLERYEIMATSNAELFPDVKEVLKALKKNNIKTGLSTNNSRKNTEFILKKHALEFDEVVTRDDGIWKPNKDPIITLMKRLHSKPEETLVVGDSDYDILAAKEAGTYCAILWRGSDLKNKSDFVIKEIKEVLDLLN